MYTQQTDNIQATSKITSHWSVSVGKNWISIKWRSKIKPPYGVKKTTTCRTMQNYEPYLEEHNVLVPLNSLLQENLKGWSVCNFTVNFVFNPASLDPGKMIRHVFTSEGPLTVA